MSNVHHCPECGQLLAPDAPKGLCPKCLLMRGRSPYEPEPTTPGGLGMAGFRPPTAQELGRSFPQLEIVELLGQGGMGAVYKARQPGLDRVVALKILPPAAAEDPAFAERFAREARALARLNHPHIVTVFDSGKAGPYFYLLMEYVDGVNLRQTLQAGTLTPEAALTIVPQICDALQYAHDEGVVHRDIKPENILVDRRGRVKVADFGLAKLLGSAQDMYSLTGSYQVLGTPRYMAPEQMEGQQSVDHRADIFSLGVVFYELLTGELPLGRFAAPSKKARIDARLDRIVMRTLEKEPQLRYQQASQIKTDMESLSARAGGYHRYNYEYKSDKTFLGLPLVHIAYGIDPATGKTRVAKGIFAMGDRAIGVVAMGGASAGLAAMGGVTVGLLTFGGASFGLVAALGGLAVGCGISIGGCAIGGLAIGGFAMGYAAVGGGTVGIHTLGGNARGGWDGNWRQILFAVMGFALSMGIAVVLALGAALALRKRPDHDREFESRPAVKPPVVRTGLPESQSGGWSITVLLLLVLVILIGVAVLGAGLWLVRGRVDVSTATPMPPPEPGATTAFEWSHQGPVASEWLGMFLQFRGRQESHVNMAIAYAWFDYLELERKHSTRTTDVHGTQTTVIEPFADELRAIENNFWTGLDAVLDVEQQAQARNLIRLYGDTELRPGRSMSELVTPGLLGWGDNKAEVHVARSGQWFQWDVNVKEWTASGSAPELPPQYQRFWEEPPAEAPR